MGANRKIKATALFSTEERIDIRFRRHLGSVENWQTVSCLVRNHYYRGERTDKTASRMPVILRPESHDTWLNGDSEPAKLRRLLRAFPASEMTSHAVSYDVNHPKIDDEHLVRRVEPNLGVTPSLF